MAQVVRKETKSSRHEERAAPRAPMYLPLKPHGITANISCKASLEEIAALGPVRCVAFMNGIAQVLSVLNPQRP